MYIYKKKSIPLHSQGLFRIASVTWMQVQKCNSYTEISLKKHVKGLDLEYVLFLN